MSTADRSGAPARDESAMRAAANRESLTAGTRLDDFEILRTIGSGGFGTVYLARDRALEREVAIKEFLPAQLAFRANGLRVAVRTPELEATYSAGLRSFVNEAKILARFNHPAIVKVHRFWEANGTAYMVMPFVRGPRLRDVRRSMRAAPTEAWLRQVIDPVLDALAMLHAEGIYHRDIAPDNILLPKVDEPVLLDFGAARRVIGDRTQTLTAVLKPSYAPIEQYAEAATLRQGPWTDMYALGAVVVYLLNALPPPPSTVRAVQDDMPLLTHKPPPGVSSTFLAAIQWALAVRPQDRPRSIQEFQSALNGRITPPVPHAPRPHVFAAADVADLPVPVPAAEPAGDDAKSDEWAVTTVAPFALHEDLPVIADARGATWDTTLRLAAKPSPTVPPPAASLGQKARASSRSTLVAAVALFAVLSIALFTMLRGVPVELDASTWRELATRAPQPDGVRAVELASARTTVPVEAATPDIKTVAVTTNQAVEAPPAAPLPSNATEIASVSLPAATALPRTVKAAGKRVATGVRKARPPHVGAVKLASRIGPREACSDHNFFTIGFCVSSKCEEPRYRTHAECVALQRSRDERMHRYGHP